MATQDVTAYQAAMKEGWTQESLEKQFYADDPLLDKIERKTPAVTIGKQAQTPVWTGRAGGYSAVPSTGSAALNAPDNQEINQAVWTYKRHWKQIQLDTAVVTQTTGSGHAVAQAVDTEVSGALSDLRKQVTRQLFMNGDALIAKTTGTATSATIALDPAGYGYQAIRNGWLPIGQQVDIGTTASEASIVGDATITAVAESSTAPTITIDSSVTLSGTTYVSVANARSGTTSYESNGMRNVVSQTTTLGGIAPGTVPGWAAASVTNAPGSLTLPLIYTKQRQANQKGEKTDWAMTSLTQQQNLYQLLQAQVRFAGDGNLGAGDSDSLQVGKTTVDAHNDCLDGDFWFLNSKRFFALRTEKPYWVPEKFGNGQPLEWKQNSTFLVSALEYYFQLATNRRNTLAGLTDLS